MPKLSAAITRLPPQTQNALIALGSHLAVARIRRKESLRTWAQRIGISVPTLLKLESGDPGVSMGAYASALWLMGRDGELARMADPSTDSAAMELDVRAAKELGARRAVSARTAAAKRAQKKAAL
ncbi:MAG: XRE family transcriptional regulator [Rhodoferax sp.]